MTPKQYASAQRRGRFRERLSQAGTVTAAMYDAGFGSSSRCYAGTTATLGMTPKAYRRGGAGEIIRFAIGQCWLGSVLVASTHLGVCAILIGDDPAELARDLRERFPAAELRGADAAYEQTVACVLGFLANPQVPCDLPLDIRGTVFQQQVWEVLQAIPVGTTITYSELAERVGKPTAVRAVAQACAANAVAVAVPCHRVVRSDGSLSGYRWGVNRKRKLLEREAKL